jgi:hypothetical protein
MTNAVHFSGSNEDERGRNYNLINKCNLTSSIDAILAADLTV